MQLFTYGQIKDKVQNDLDLRDETFVSPTELMGYCNEAIDEIEAIIHTIYEDYFLKKGNITFVVNQSEYDLPTDIYANKIRKIFYNNQNDSERYEITNEKNLAKLLDVDVNDYYRYKITNASAGNTKLQLYPAARVAGAVAEIWYLRNANTVTQDSDICDIPEFHHVIIQHMKVSCLEKEGHPNTESERAKLENMKKLMVETLTNMIDDRNTLIEPDVSFYQDFNRDYEVIN